MEKVKKFFKNHSKKLIAFIGVMFTCIFSILGITNLHAEENDGLNNYIDSTTEKFYQQISRVDLGSLDWDLYQSVFYALIPNKLNNTNNIGLCSNYPVSSTNYQGLVAAQQMNDNESALSINTQNPYIYVKDSDYIDAASFKTAMSGVYLYYELQTPIELDYTDYIPYTELLNDFNTLLQQYNDLHQQYNNSRYSIFNGCSLGIWTSQNASPTYYDFNYLTTNNYLTTSSLSLYNMTQALYSDTNFYQISIFLNEDINYLPSDVDITILNGSSNYININYYVGGDTDNEAVKTIYIDSDRFIINSQTLGLSYDDVISLLYFQNVNSEFVPNIEFNSSYSYGYVDGYEQGYQTSNISKNEEIAELNEDIDNLIDRLNDALEANSTARTEGYRAGLEEGQAQSLDDTGLPSLFNAILSYPVNFVKEVFNFEFMGVNIAGLITFLLSVGIVIFIIGYFRKK